MKMLQTGDTCPICGLTIRTKDPNKLIFLSATAWYRELMDSEHGPANLCLGDEPTGATNADKLRSLPDEEIEAIFIGCPGTEFGGVVCYDLDPDVGRHETDCVTCTKNWLKAPHTGWEA